MMIGKQLRK